MLNTGAAAAITGVRWLLVDMPPARYYVAFFFR